MKQFIANAFDGKLCLLGLQIDETTHDKDAGGEVEQRHQPNDGDSEDAECLALDRHANKSAVVLMGISEKVTKTLRGGLSVQKDCGPVPQSLGKYLRRF